MVLYPATDVVASFLLMPPYNFCMDANAQGGVVVVLLLFLLGNNSCANRWAASARVAPCFIQVMSKPVMRCCTQTNTPKTLQRQWYTKTAGKNTGFQHELYKPPKNFTLFMVQPSNNQVRISCCLLLLQKAGSKIFLFRICLLKKLNLLRTNN